MSVTPSFADIVNYKMHMETLKRDFEEDFEAMVVEYNNEQKREEQAKQDRKIWKSKQRKHLKKRRQLNKYIREEME